MKRVEKKARQVETQRVSDIIRLKFRDIEKQTMMMMRGRETNENKKKKMKENAVRHHRITKQNGSNGKYRMNTHFSYYVYNNTKYLLFFKMKKKESSQVIDRKIIEGETKKIEILKKTE